MGATKVEELYVEFLQKGFEDLQSKLDAVLSKFREMSNGVTGFASQTSTSTDTAVESMGGMGKEIESVCNNVAKQTASLANTVSGSVNAMATASQIGTNKTKSQYSSLASSVAQFFTDLQKNPSATIGNSLASIGDKVKSVYTSVSGSIGQFAATTQKNAKDLADSTQSRLGEFGKLLVGFEIFHRATDWVIGFAKAGLQASQMGDVLNNSLTRLSLSIGGLFGPEIEKINQLIRGLTSWIDGWDASTKRTVAGIVLTTTATAAIAGAIGIATVAVHQLTAAVIELEAATGVGLILPILGATAAALGGLAIGTEAGQKSLANLGNTLAPLGTGFLKLWDSLQPLMNALWQLAEIAGSGIAMVAKFAGELVSGLAPAFNLVSGLAGLAINVLAVPLQFLMGIFEGLFEVFGQLALAIKDVLEPFTDLFENVLGTFGEVMKWLGGELKSLGKSIVEFLLAPIRLLIEGLKMASSLLEALGLKKVKSPNSEASDRNALARKSTGVSSLESFYERIAKETLSMGSGRSVEQEQLDEMKKISANTEKMAGASPNPPPLTR